MTDQLRQAAQQALEALKGVLDDNPKVLEASISGGLYEVVQCRDAITALRTALEQQAEPPPEWPLIKNILAVFGLDAIAFVAKWKAAQQQAEPICPDCKAALLYECIGCSSNNYPPKRPWVGLTEFEFAEIYNKWNDTNGSTPWGLNQALEAKLKELNT